MFFPVGGQMSNLFDQMQVANIAFEICPCKETLIPLETAEKDYFAALSDARANWEAVDNNFAKQCAEINAYDTMFEQSVNERDELQWLIYALGSLGLVINSDI